MSAPTRILTIDRSIVCDGCGTPKGAHIEMHGEPVSVTPGREGPEPEQEQVEQCGEWIDSAEWRRRLVAMRADTRGRLLGTRADLEDTIGRLRDQVDVATDRRGDTVFTLDVGVRHGTFRVSMCGPKERESEMLRAAARELVEYVQEVGGESLVTAIGTMVGAVFVNMGRTGVDRDAEVETGAHCPGCGDPSRYASSGCPGFAEVRS